MPGGQGLPGKTRGCGKVRQRGAGVCVEIAQAVSHQDPVCRDKRNDVGDCSGRCKGKIFSTELRKGEAGVRVPQSLPQAGQKKEASGPMRKTP